MLALLKTKNLRKLTKSIKLQFKKKRDKEEDSEESHEETSEDEQEDEEEEEEQEEEKEEVRVKENEVNKKEKTHSKSKFIFFDFHLKLKDLDNYIVNAKNVADVRSKANLIQRIRREHEEYKDKDPTFKDFSVFFSKYSEEKEVYTIILGLDPEDTYEEWFLKMEQDCLKEQISNKRRQGYLRTRINRIHVLSGDVYELSSPPRICKAFHKK